MSTRSVVIKEFLNQHSSMASMYSLDMECQVIVAKDEGEPVTGEYLGKKWKGYTDGLDTWKSFRIPYNAATKPVFNDEVVKFNFPKHVEAIGMTGWDWKNLCSRWVAYDFDAITGHSDKHAQKLTQEELLSVLNAIQSIPWVQARKSSSGKGIHLYVFLEPVATNNHHEHAAVARAILAKMSALAGYDFKAKVDICGGNMWVWHRKGKGNKEAFALIKPHTETLKEVPSNWRDHLTVVKGRADRVVPVFVEKDGLDSFDQLSGQYTHVALDEEHKKLISWFQAKGDRVWWWDTERSMLVTHTIYLKEAHDELKLKGIFDTMSKGTERGADHNCFAYPLKNGAWVVRRFSAGCLEHISWTQDKAGWTRCFLNRNPDFLTAVRSYGGVELPKNKGYKFTAASEAIKVYKSLGISFEVPAHMLTREAIIQEQKDGKLIFKMVHTDQDQALPMFTTEKNEWIRVFDPPKVTHEQDTPVCDDIVRHTVTELERVNSGWYVKVNGHWQKEPLEHVRAVLANEGHLPNVIQPIIGLCVQRSWREVNQPFKLEYPGNRDWNRRGAQFRVTPNKDIDNLKYPTWLKVLEHLGKTLDDNLKANQWAKDNAIMSGSDYLKCWIASMFQDPFAPLPYLFFFGPQDCGKSVFHEALDLLFNRGLVKADHALINNNGFNGELANAVLCIIEETDLSNAKYAYARVKDWVTSRNITIHEKGKTPYQLPNSTHWVQTANEQTFCPSFSGDTRITVIRVNPLDPFDLIPKVKLMERLAAEAPDFLGALMSLELPEAVGRLNLPVIATTEKLNMESINENLLDKFIKEKMHSNPSKLLKYSEVHTKFVEWLPPEARHEWGIIKFGRQFPVNYPHGTHVNNVSYLAGLSWEPATPEELLKPGWVKLPTGQLREVADGKNT